MLRTVAACAALVAFAALATVNAQVQPSPVAPSPVKRTILQKVDVSGTNLELIYATVEIAPGFKAGRHFHPGVAMALVVEGEFWFQLDGQPEKVLRAGESLTLRSRNPQRRRIGAGGEADRRLRGREGQAARFPGAIAYRRSRQGDNKSQRRDVPSRHINAARSLWLEHLYSPENARRSSKQAPGSPAFGEESVLGRGPKGKPPVGGSVRPGLHTPVPDGASVVKSHACLFVAGADRTRPRPTWTAPAGCVHQWARVAHGRTRMTVFPARRSVALKVATASSRAETLPMFVRSRPSRTRWTISLSWARSNSTTKSTARPSAGRASVGPTMDTSVPPAENQACGPLLDVAADDIEHQIDAADVFQRVVVEVDELLRAEVERLLTVGSASGADDVAAGLTSELRHHRPDCAGRAVREDALPRLKTAVLEQVPATR